MSQKSRSIQKKYFLALLLTAGMLFGAPADSKAIDFKAKGEWLVGFGLGNANLGSGEVVHKDDLFSAAQRFRLQLDAIASEQLSGTIFFEIGTQDWGDNRRGGALGADGDNAVKIKNAYIDWIVPETDLTLRMGLQHLTLPNAAGGTAIMDGDVAAIVGSYKINDNAALTAFWMRPANDNYQGSLKRNYSDFHYLDNIDFFGLTLPLTFGGVQITPWAMYGMIGRNALDGFNGWSVNFNASDGDLRNTLFASLPGGIQNGDNLNLHRGFGSQSRAYADAWFFGLPITVTMFEPLRIEFDANYGYVSGVGRTRVEDNKDNERGLRADTQRQGWLLKALVEYKMDWGIPGIFGWYASGDDGDVKNGSERMPSVAGAGSFTSFMGKAGTDWWADNTKGRFYEKNMTYAGTWGIGVHLRNMSFLDSLYHTFRVAYWGGTNSTNMIRYVEYSAAGMLGENFDGPYLTTNDGLLEFNLDNIYKIYDNLSVRLDLGYIVNMMDRGTWARWWIQGDDGPGFSKHDAWKAQLTFCYTF